MTRTLSTTGSNSSDNLSCPHCNTQLPSQAVFCSSCGEQFEQKKNGELDSNTQYGSVEAQEQEAKTIRLVILPQIYLKRWQAHRSLKNNKLSGQSQDSSPSLQDGDAPTQPISSDTETESADAPSQREAPIQIEPAQSSPTTPAPSIPKTSEQISIRSNLLWPTIIIFSAVAAGLVYFVFTDTLVRPAVIFWFLFVCPGMIVVRFLRLKEPIVEWTLALALSFAIDAIVAAIQLYAGKWSPTGTLTILIGLSLCGAIFQLVNSTTSVSKLLYTVRSRSVPTLLHTVRSRKPGVLLPILLSLLVGIVVGASLWSDEVYHSSHSVTTASAQLHGTTTHSSSMVVSAPTPSAIRAGSYHGTIFNIAANLTTKMSLTGIQPGSISGYFTGLSLKGPFKGFIDATKQIQLIVTESAGHATLSIDGNVQSDGNIGGNYCSLNQAERCGGSYGYGLWSVAPAS